MTNSCCWVDISGDASLMKRVQENAFCSDGSKSAPVGFPPGPNGYWTHILGSWCDDHSVQYTHVDTVLPQICARMKRDQILAFVSHCYDSDGSYSDPERMLTWQGQAYLVIRLVNFRAFLAQNLKKSRYYSVVASEDD